MNSIEKTKQDAEDFDGEVTSLYADDLSRSFSDFSIDVQATLLSHPGPALLVDGRLAPLSINTSGEPLARLIAKGDEIPAAAKLRSAVREASLLKMPTETRLEISPEGDFDTFHTYDITALPCAGPASEGAAVLVLARETTLESSITEALVSSRELFQDLVKCSSDFAWETNRDGRFEFVNVRGSSPFSADRLNGTDADALLDLEASDVPKDWSPFKIRFPIEDVEVWLRAPDGPSRCMLMTVIPLLDAKGQFLGTRGACVDVTSLRHNEALVKAARRKEDLVDRIVETVRAEFEPGSMLRTAALEIGDVLAADFGAIAMADDAHEVFSIGAMSGEPGSVDAVQADKLVGGLVAGDLLNDEGRIGVQDRMLGRRTVLLCGTRFGGEINGAIVLWRKDDAEPWSDEDRSLLKHIASHLGLALAQAAHARALERLSRQDSLTGLLNRRAFFEEAESCLARNVRSMDILSYVYFDLDRFKQVNDTMGHSVGDATLVAFSGVLRELTRRGDVAVRLGGDEFGILLDLCPAEDAALKATRVISKLGEIVKERGLPDVLSVSAGIATWDPCSGETIGALMDRADRALYGAKRDGRGICRVADAAMPGDGQGGRNAEDH